MKNRVFFLISLLLMSSCAVPKVPIFLRVDNVKVLRFKSDTIQLKATAFFENPNAVGGKISTNTIKIFVNGVAVAQVFSKEFKVPATTTFSMPLIAQVSTKKLLSSNKKGLLEGVMSSVMTNKATVRVKGNLEYIIFGFRRSFLVDTTQEIKIKF